MAEEAWNGSGIRFLSAFFDFLGQKKLSKLYNVGFRLGALTLGRKVGY